jgi:hypothetical protein
MFEVEFVCLDMMDDRQPIGNKLIAIYARVSTARQEEDGTIETQLRVLRDFAQQNSCVIVKEYVDDGWSGDILARPSLDSLRADATKKFWVAVLIYDPDRLARRYSYQELVMDELRERGIEVMFVNFFGARSTQLAALTVRHTVPEIFRHAFALAGGLMGYGASETDAYRVVGEYTGRILKGGKPSDLPVQQATKIELSRRSAPAYHGQRCVSSSCTLRPFQPSSGATRPARTAHSTSTQDADLGVRGQAIAARYECNAIIKI